MIGRAVVGIVVAGVVGLGVEAGVVPPVVKKLKILKRKFVHNIHL